MADDAINGTLLHSIVHFDYAMGHEPVSESVCGNDGRTKGVGDNAIM